MAEANDSTHDLLMRLEDSRYDLQGALRQTISRTKRLHATRRVVRTILAATLAVGVSAPVFAAGLAIGHRVPAKARPASAQEGVADRFGGTLIWGTVGGKELAWQAAGTEVTTTTSFVVTRAVALAPDRQDLVTWGGDGFVIVASDGHETPVTDSAKGIGSPVWAPNGASFAFETCDPWPACQLRVATADPATTTALVPSSGRGISWSPDSSRLAFVDPSGVLSVVSDSTGAVADLGSGSDLAAKAGLSSQATREVYVVDPLWSPTGEYLAATLDMGSNFAPVVLTPAGDFVAAGPTGTLSPPSLAWVDSDELFVAEGPREGGFASPVSSALSVMASPAWNPVELVAFRGESVRGLFTSPTGTDLIWQTYDQEAAEATQGRTTSTQWWNVMDVNSKSLVSRIRAPGELLDWR